MTKADIKAFNLRIWNHGICEMFENSSKIWLKDMIDEKS